MILTPLKTADNDADNDTDNDTRNTKALGNRR